MVTLDLKNYEEHLFEYKFVKGLCTKGRKGKIYSTYESHMSVPFLSKEEGSCGIEYRFCEKTCSEWMPLFFEQKSQDFSQDSLGVLLKTQFEKEQELQDLAKSVIQKIDKLIPNQKVCLDQTKLAQMDELFKLKPKEISELLKYDFSQQERDLLNQLSSDSSKDSSEYPFGLSSTDVSKIVAIVGLPFTVMLYIKTGVSGYELYRWKSFLAKERNVNGVKYVRHSSGLFVPEKDKHKILEELTSVRMEDPAYKTFLDEDKSKRFLAFLKEEEGKEWRYSKRNWYKEANGKKEYFDFERTQKGKKFEIDIDTYGRPKGIYVDKTFKELSSEYRVTRLRSSYDPRNGNVFTDRLGSKGKILLLITSLVSLGLSTGKIIQAALNLSETDTCASFYQTIQSMIDDLKKATLIKNDLISIKFRIQAEL